MSGGLSQINTCDHACKHSAEGFAIRGLRRKMVFARPYLKEDGNWDAVSIDSNPLLRRPSKLIASRFPTHRAIAATGLGCVQAGAQKLGVLEASYASAIIGVDRRFEPIPEEEFTQERLLGK